ncbi:MAG: FtsX-like permease family protein [Muricoprocola sp.]
MKKTALRKDFYMEVKKSLNRFISIFLIVALGVAFYSGIQSAAPDMRYSGDAYFDENHLMDLKVISTMGLTEDDVSEISRVEGVSKAEPGYMTDVLCGDDSSSHVLHIESICETLNQLTPQEGRLPEKAGECFLDIEFLDKTGYEIGDTITFYLEDEEDYILKRHEFTIVGAGSSPLYISFNRGNTTLGTGELSGAGYILPEDFDSEVYIQVYIEAEEARNLTAYTDAYDYLIETVQNRIEEIAGERCEIRYREVLDEANEKIQDAREELEDGEAEAESELTEAWDELYDGEMELYYGKLELARGERELAKGEEEYADGLKELEDNEKKISDGRQELEDGWSKLKEGKEELAANEATFQSEYAKASKELKDGEKALKEAKAKIKDGKAQYKEGLAQYQSGLAQYEKGEEEYAAGLADYEKNAAAWPDTKAGLEAQKAELQAQKPQLEAQRAEVEAQKPSLEAQKTELEAQKSELETQRSQLQAAVDQISSQIAEYETAYQGALSQAQSLESEIAGLQNQIAEEQGKEEPDSEKIAQLQGEINQKNSSLQELQTQSNAAQAAMQQCQGMLEEYQSQLGQVDGGLSQVNEGISQIDAGLSQIEEGIAEIDNGLNQIDSGISQIDTGIEQGEAQLAQAPKDLEAARAQLDETKASLKEAKAQLKSSKAELDSGEEEITKNEKKLKEGQKKLANGQAQIESAKQTIAENEQLLLDSQKELEDGEAELEDGRKELADAQKELEDAKAEILDAKEEIQENEPEIRDGKLSYARGEKKAADEIAEAKEKLADAEDEVTKLKIPEWTVSDRSTLPENIGYGENADRMRSLGQVFPVLFFLVAALISLTTMTRMVEEERTQIGTMKALGYGKLQIAGKYLGYAFFATLGGSIFGVLLGEKSLPYVIVTAYKIMYHHMPNIELPYNMKYAVIATGAALVSTMTATYAACNKELASTPAVLMRPPAPKEGKRVFLERIPWIWKHLSFTWKSTVRNLLRYKKRFFMTVFGIGGCMGLLLVGYGLRDSISGIVDLQFKNLQLYDGMVILDTDAEEEEIQELRTAVEADEGISNSMDVFMKKVSVSKDKKSWSIYVMVPGDLESTSEFLKFRDRNSLEPYELTDEGAILTEKIASMMGIKAGDTIILEDEDEGNVEVPVVEITENYLSHYIYMTPGLYQKCFGKAPEYNEIMFRAKADTDDDINVLGEKFLKYDGALSISYASTTRASIDSMLSTLDSVIIVLIVSAGLLAFVVLYNLSNININERKRELATLKVLGFYNGEVDAYVYRENILITLIGIVAGVFLGKLLHYFVITTVEVDATMFARDIHLSSFIIATAFTVVFSALVNGFMHFKLKKIDMVESLKSVE